MWPEAVVIMDPWLIDSLLRGRTWVRSLVRPTPTLRVLTNVFIRISAQPQISAHLE